MENIKEIESLKHERAMRAELNDGRSRKNLRKRNTHLTVKKKKRK